MFTATYFSRFMVAIWYDRTRPAVLPPEGRPPPALVPDDTKIPFFRYRWIAFAWSVFVLFATIIIWINGLNLGIDFSGGVDRGAHRRPADLGLDARDACPARARRRLPADRGQRRPGDDPRQGARGRRGGPGQTVERVKTALDKAVGQGLSYQRSEFVGPAGSPELRSTASGRC
ncbi:MAG: hypothetical protein U1E17_14635 [Geminicoccaceae bacterium]